MSRWSSIARRIRVPLGFAFTLTYLWLAKPTMTSLVAGAGLVIPGLVVRALASGHVQKNQQLATSGPYAYTRNPLYLGSLILAVGFGLAARSEWIAVGVVLIFFAIYWPVIRDEEELLREKFPQYTEYAGRVPRLFPRLTPFGQSSGSFSWELYRQHREYNALAGSLAILAALLIKVLKLA